MCFSSEVDFAEHGLCSDGLIRFLTVYAGLADWSLLIKKKTDWCLLSVSRIVFRTSKCHFKTREFQVLRIS